MAGNENNQFAAKAELDMTPEEREKILSGVLLSREPPVLKAYPAKYKRKIPVLELLSGRFEPGRVYTQREVNDILEAAWHDPVTIRRDMIEAGLLLRDRAGSAYWREKNL